MQQLLTHTIGVGHKALNKKGNTYENIGDYILSLPRDIPAGTDAQMTVWYAGKTVFRIADCVSLTSAVLLALHIVSGRRHKGEKCPNDKKRT